MAYKNERRRSENDVLDKQSEREMPFLRINFILMAIAGIMIVLGFLLMAGQVTGVHSILIYFRLAGL